MLVSAAVAQQWAADSATTHTQKTQATNLSRWPPSHRPPPSRTFAWPTPCAQRSLGSALHNEHGTDRRTCTQERQQQPLVRYGAERLVDVPARRTYSPPPLRLRRYGGAAPRPGSSPIRGVGGLCTDVARAAAPHWLRPTIIAIWPARAGEAAGRSAQQCFPCCLLDPPIPGSAVDRSLYIRSGLP
jgi:hypothetical protein